MAKKIAEVDILTDTFETHILRTNEIIAAIGSDVITANTTQGITGSAATPRHARLYGSFTANNLSANALSLGAIAANSSEFSISTGVKLIASGSAGAPGQALVSDGTSVSWQTIAGSGTVTQIANGAGIVFTSVAGKAYDSPITSYGTINLKAGDGIVIDARGISINTTFISSSVSNASTLLGRTWESPGAIGKVTANTGVFTGVTASPIDGYRFRGDDVFLISNSVFITQGRADVQTPYFNATDTTGGVRVRGQRSPGTVAYIQVTDSLGQAEWGNFKVHANGYCVWSGSLSAGSFSNLIPAGTIMLFAQANAPTGWTKITSHDNKALRVVSGSGGGSGGTTSFSSVFNTQFNVDGHVLTEAELPSHSHALAEHSSSTSALSTYGGRLASYGSYGGNERYLLSSSGGGPDCGVTGSTGSSQPHNHTMNFDLAYVDVILASKN